MSAETEYMIRNFGEIDDDLADKIEVLDEAKRALAAAEIALTKADDVCGGLDGDIGVLQDIQAGVDVRRAEIEEFG